MIIIKEMVYPSFLRPTKWLGIIEYKAMIFLLIYVVGIYTVSGLFTTNVMSQIYVICIFTIPVVCTCIANSNKEDMLNVINICVRYILRPKIYLAFEEDRISLEGELNKVN